MNAKLEPLLLTLEDGCAKLAAATAKLHARVLAHAAADAEADARMLELKRRASARDRFRFNGGRR